MTLLAPVADPSNRWPSTAARNVLPCTTPFLLDDSTGVPGHSCAIRKAGRQRWYGEFPSSWPAPQQLLAEIRKRLSLPAESQDLYPLTPYPVGV